MKRKFRTYHCSVCNTPRVESFKGTRCKDCYNKYQKDYFKKNQQTLQSKKLEKLRKESAQTLHERTLAKIAREKHNKEQQKIRAAFRYQFKKVSIKRNPIKPNPDREIYCDNTTWQKDLNMHISFDNIRDCPKEHLNIRHWKDLERAEAEAYANISIRGITDESNWLRNNSYTREELEPELLTRNGFIRFYPT